MNQSARETRYDDEASWLDARRLVIGSSDGPEILGKGYRGPLSVYADKIAENSPREPTWAMRRGHAMESAIAAEFAARTGLVVTDPGEYTIYTAADHPWVGATPDRLVPAGVLEIKTVGRWAQQHWDEQPSEYALIQVQHQLLATGLGEWHVAAEIGGEAPVFYEGERNERFIAAYVVVLAEFHQCVVARQPRADWVNGSDATREAIHRLHPKDRGLTISLPESFVALDARRVELQAQLKSLGDEKDALDNRLRLEIGDAETAVLPSGVEYSLKTQSRKAYTVAASESRVLRRKERK